jgi:excinuclease ABC subunit C
MLGKNEFVLEIFDDMEEEIIDHVFTYYMKHDLPQEIITSSKKIQEELSFLLDIKVVVPTLGSKKEMLLIALENAKKGLDEHFLTSRLEDDVLSTLEELGKLLKIKTPLRIELFDNSHLQGSFPVGAMVCFINGNKAPGEYRKFNINNSSGQDDLKSMEEVITRRYSRLLNENKTFPDLIIVDGGATQINVAQEVLDNLGLEIPLCGLAKDNHHHTNGLVYHGEEYFLDRKSKLFLLLVRMQDEVHRFALSTHVNKRSKNLTSTFYDEIPGIGKKRKEMLLKAYPTLNDILKASVAEIAQIVPEAVAKNIVNYLNSKEVTHESKDD